MLFNTPGFAAFLVLIVTLCWALSRTSRARMPVLLAASYYFYGCWDVRFLALIGGVTLIDYVAARVIARLPHRNSRLLVLAVTVGLNLGLLGFWKYYDFFARSLAPLLAQVQAPLPVLQLVLPVGISFFTFQGLSYVIDVYRRDIEPERSLARFALFISFFPQLVAGPIVRASQLLPQLDGPTRVEPEHFGRGLLLILGGLTKKVVLADYLAANLVDRVFDLPRHHSSIEVLAGIYGYSLQIYGDFSGYSDIAIGAALLLGIELPINFDAPYRAHDLRDFWRRWHISLSRWLRDYLYISMGGSRGGRLATSRNLMITMLLGGLWHGASYTFVLWGGLHGAILVAGRLRERLLGAKAAQPRTPRWLRVLVTFHIVSALWVFFRSDSLSGALIVFEQLLSFVPGSTNLSWQLIALIAAGFASHFMPRDWYQRLTATFVRAPATAQAAATIAVLYLVQEVAATSPAPFIYFQF